MNKIKFINLNKEEQEIIKIAERHGLKQWGYKTWRFKRTRKGKLEEYILTKSIANKGEWSLVQKFSNKTKIKMTTDDMPTLKYAIISI